MRTVLTQLHRGTSGAHTAIVAKTGSRLMLVSHGSEAGPPYRAYNCRSDVLAIRRYV
jgi:hypothetical protein